MFVKQISVFIENRPGRLAGITKVLGENNIDLIALSIGDTTDFGILRAIVNKNEEALAVAREAGYTASLTEVLAVAVPDKPGGLDQVLYMLNDANIAIEYLYSFVRRVGSDAVIIFRVDQPQKAYEVLNAAQVKLLTQEQIAQC